MECGPFPHRSWLAPTWSAAGSAASAGASEGWVGSGAAGPAIVGNNIARQIEGKFAYRRAVKTAIAATMRAGAEGIKVQVSGRLNGAEMARSEMYKEGRTPLHTFRADIDYAQCEALTKVGLIGIKVWICRGLLFQLALFLPGESRGQGSLVGCRLWGRTESDTTEVT